MGLHNSPAIGLEYLLGLDGNIEVQNDAGYWVKMEVASVPLTAERPHGVRYSLTLHAPDNTRLIGFDNAHGVKPADSRLTHVSGMRVKSLPTTTVIDMLWTRGCCTSLTPLTNWSVIFMLK